MSIYVHQLAGFSGSLATLQTTIGTLIQLHGEDAMIDFYVEEDGRGDDQSAARIIEEGDLNG